MLLTFYIWGFGKAVGLSILKYGKIIFNNSNIFRNNISLND